MDKEKDVKRLPPKEAVLRQLYLWSGNQCAFPGCSEPLIDLDGNWIAQVCHIEAALPKGERFNSGMTEEQRREAANLLLLCYPHHIATDDVSRFSVEALRDMKSKHEAKYLRGISSMIETVSDTTRANEPHLAVSLKGIFPDLDSEQVAEMLPELNRLAAILRKLSEPARQTFEILLARAQIKHREALVLAFSELADVTRLDEELLAERIGQLAVRDLASFDDPEYYDMFGPVVSILGRNLWPDWPEIFIHLRDFVGDDEDRSRRLFVEMDLTILDEPSQSS